MLTPEQQAEINRLIYEESASEILAAVGCMEDATQLFAIASHYNWDDGFAVPTAIANHPKCDLATALTLFWDAESAECYGIERPTERRKAEWFDYCQLLTTRIVGGYYSVGINAFEGFDGVQRYTLEKRGLPAVLLDPVVPAI